MSTNYFCYQLLSRLTQKKHKIECKSPFNYNSARRAASIWTVPTQKIRQISRYCICWLQFCGVDYRGLLLLFAFIFCMGWARDIGQDGMQKKKKKKECNSALITSVSTSHEPIFVKAQLWVFFCAVLCLRMCLLPFSVKSYEIACIEQ